jgi:hypothetical protein
VIRAADRRRRARPVERALQPPVPGAAFQDGLYIPLDQIEITESGGAAAVLNGNLAVSWVGSTFDGSLDDDEQLESARAGVALRGAATLELAVDAGADTAGLLRLAMIPLPPISAGPSIEVSPFVEVRLHLAASADADARISVVAPFRLGSGFAFDGSLRAGMSSPPRHEPQIGLPDSPVALAGGVDLEIILALLIAIEGVPVGGPVIGASLGTIIEVDAGGGSTHPAIAALAEAPSSDIIAVGEVDHTDLADPSLPPIDRQNALILRLRPDGTLVSGFALGGTGSEKASRVAVAQHGSYVIGGHLGGAPNAWLASLRADDSLRWSASYRSRPHASGVDFTTLTGLAAIPDGVLACGHMEPPGVDAWLIRVDEEGMPVWAKTFVGADSTDEPAAVVALADGLVMCGRTEVKEDVSTHGDLWVVRANVDANLHFLADSGLACECTAAEWQRLTDDHSMRTLAPTSVPVTLDVDPEEELQTDPASVFGELLTD